MTWVSHTLSDRFWSSGLDLRTLPNYNCSHINKIHFLLMTYPLIILLLILRSFYWCISLVAQLVKNLPATQETPVWFLGWEDSPREGIGYQLQYSWASLVAQLVKNLPAIWETWFNPWVEKIPWRREQLPTPVFRLGEYHGLDSMGLQRVRHYWATFTLMHSQGAWVFEPLFSVLKETPSHLLFLGKMLLDLL